MLTWLETNHDSGRDPDIILRVAEESGLQQVALQAPTDKRDQVIVEAATHRVSK
jgi:hypothetical protein